MPVSDHPGALKLQRHFVRKAMGLELELELTEQDLLDIWMSPEARSHFQIASIQLSGANQKNEPEEADIEIDGDSMDTDWDESDWQSAKKAAVRQKMACLLNDAQNLPQIGRRVERIVRQVGTVDIYFDDGSFVSASVTDPQPSTSDEAAVIERIYGSPAKPKSCGCKHASCEHTKTAMPVIDMVAAVWRNELQGAMDIRKRGAKDPRFWSYKVDGPFELYVLKDVPLDLARELTDFPKRTVRLPNHRQAWNRAREFAQGRPFKRVSR